MAQKSETGKLGEGLARAFLKKQGYQILDERFRTRFGELDIVCRKGRTLVFVEVRSAQESGDFLPEESVGPQKISRIIKSAQTWLSKKRLQGFDLRFDLITVKFSADAPVISHYPAAFESSLDF